jgi:hypothetical protein
MRNTSKILVIIGVVAAVAIIATVIKLGKGGGDYSSNIAPTHQDQSAQAPQVGANPTSKIQHIVRPATQPIQPRPSPVVTGATNGNSTPAKTAPGLITDWEEKVDGIISPEGDEKEKAQKLIDIFPHLPADGQEEVAHHLSNLVADEDYAPLSNFATNSALPEAVLDVFVEDVFNRPNSVKLPVLLDIAQDPQHPRAAEAKDVLELFLEEDFGSDWTKWQAKMAQWLKDNPD